MKTPRILPLAAVAVGGVLAAKGLAAAGALPALLDGMSSVAQAAAPPPKSASPAKPPVPSAKAAQTPVPAAPAACAPSAAQLAKEAGLSPAELQMLQNLGARRGQLDAREQAIDTQVQLLAAAEVKVDAKIKAMNAAKAQVQALLGQADQKTQDEVDRLVVVYEKMKPRDAGAVMAALDDKVRVPVAAKIAAEKPAILAAILSGMGTQGAKELTEALARRYAAARAAAEQAQGKAVDVATAAGVAPPKAADAKPTQVADAGATPADAADDGKTSDAPKPVPARKPAARKPIHRAAYKPPAATDLVPTTYIPPPKPAATPVNTPAAAPTTKPAAAPATAAPPAAPSAKTAAAPAHAAAG